MTHLNRRRITVYAIAAGVACAGVPASAATATAAGSHVAASSRPPAAAKLGTAATTATTTTPGSWMDQLTRQKEVAFAEAHWSWTAWNDPTPVPAGSSQDEYQCAEFVARSMAAAGLIPGLSPDSPQNDYFNYTAPNGTTYDLLLISPLPQYHNIYDYLMDSGLGIDVGDDPADARPGDFVVTYLGTDGEASHMGVIATAPTGTTEATVDAHNNARHQYGYHYYAPSHLVELAPNAWAKASAWANSGPHTVAGSPTTHLQAHLPFVDPAPPQV